jgi:iron(III) transport system ATP-binding protein
MSESSDHEGGGASRRGDRNDTTDGGAATGAGGIVFVGVSKRYGGPGSPLAVDAVSFEVPSGTLTTILGPSGCGKTTTLRMIAGLETPTSGRILIAGRDVTTLAPSERDVSMVFQSYALFPHMDVLGNVGYGLSVSGVAAAEVRARAQAALASVGLVGMDARRPSELSGGQQQRVALARALVLEPAVLLFDEPLSNLDARLRRSMREEIRGLQQRLGLTVAYVTHDQAEAMAVSDQVIVMDHGTIAQAGTPRELYERPRTAFVAGFMGEATLFDGVALEDGSVRLGPLAVRPNGSGPKWSAGAVKIAVRPEAWSVEAASTDGLPAQVAKAAYLGGTTEYTFETGIGAIFVAAPAAAGEHRVGDAVTLRLSGGCAVLGG